jgi:hypothetical protein
VGRRFEPVWAHNLARGKKEFHEEDMAVIASSFS